MSLQTARIQCGIILLLTVVCGTVITSNAAAQPLELATFLARVEGSPQIILRVTNTGDDPVTVLTQNYVLRTHVNADGSLETMSVEFALPMVGKGDKKWSYLPSLAALGPVTLRKGEHAGVLVTPSLAMRQSIVGHNVQYSVRYEIKAAIAKRYKLWHGTLELNKSATPIHVEPTVAVVRSMPGSIREVDDRRDAEERDFERDPTPLLKVGDIISFRPAPGSTLRTRQKGVFNGMQRNYVMIGNRKVRLFDIHPKDRKAFERFRDFTQNSRW